MSSPVWWQVTLQLAALQTVLGGLAYFVYGYTWPARVMGLIHLVAVWQVAAALRGAPLAAVLGAALLAQLPGLLGAANIALEQLRLYRHNSLGDTLDFVMETWHTVLLPWLRLLPGRAVSTRSGEAIVPFFLAQALLSPLLVVWVALAALSG